MPSSPSPTDLDIEQSDQLLAYLRREDHIAPDETPTFELLTGGVSNRTVLVTRPGGEAWVIKQALEKLRVKVDWFSDPARVHREAMGLRHLPALAPAGSITQLVFEDHSHHLFAMAAVPQPHENWKDCILQGRVDLAYVTQFGQLLGSIHAQSAGDAQLAAEFADRSFFESLCRKPYYAYAAEQVPAAADFLNALIQNTRRRQLTLVHGDFSPKNILVHDGHLVLLDHEVIHFGDPAFDVGFAVTHLLSKAHHLTPHTQALVDAALCFWREYRKAVAHVATMEDVEQLAVSHTLGCLLARVAGRSPLEYLTPAERVTQQGIVVSMMGMPIAGMDHLIRLFAGAL